jgi:hypothetical protein
MADSQMGAPRTNFTNSLKAVDGMGGTGSGLTTPVNYSSVSAMRTRLAAANAGYYTTAKLNEMTVNDMIFALRSIDDKTTISSQQPTSTA